MQGYIQFCLIKLALVGIPCIGAILAVRHWNRIGVKTLLGWLVVRTVICFLLLKYTQLDSFDLHGWYQHATWIAHGHHVPGIDFLTPYGLGFELLNATAVRIFDSEYSIATFFVVCELLALVLIKNPLARLFSDKVARQTLILFESSTLVLANSLSTQDEMVVLLCVAILLRLALARSSAVQMALVGGLTLACTKLLAPFYFFCLFVARRWKGLVCLICALGAYWLLLISLGINPFDLRFGRELGLSARADQIVSGLAPGSSSLLWYFPSIPRSAMNVLLLFSFSAAGWAYLPGLVSGCLTERLKAALCCSAVLGLLFQLFYPSYYSCYAIPTLPLVIACTLQQCENERKLLALLVLWGWSVDGVLPSAARWDPIRPFIWGAFALCQITLIALLVKRSHAYLKLPFGKVKEFFGE